MGVLKNQSRIETYLKAIYYRIERSENKFLNDLVTGTTDRPKKDHVIKCINDNNPPDNAGLTQSKIEIKSEHIDENEYCWNIENEVSPLNSKCAENATPSSGLNVGLDSNSS